jgi:N-acetylmuramoyl-L-alanine amidase
MQLGISDKFAICQYQLECKFVLNMSNRELIPGRWVVLLYINKWWVVCSILLLITPVVISADNDNNIDLTFAGVKLSSEVRVIEKDGAKYINLPFLKYLHVVNDWDPDTGGIDLRLGNFSFRMSENSTRYQVNGSSRRLTHAPFQRDSQLWLPLEFLLRLGLVIKGQDGRNLKLDWEHNYLLGIENVKYQERPAFLLVGARSFKTKSFLLAKPNRLVVELTGVKAHFTLDCHTGDDPLVKKIRFSQIAPGTVRLVFDLERSVGYKIIPNPGQEGQVLIVFNYLVQEISFYQNEEEHKVYIKTSHPAVYDLKSFNEPNRLIIDFDGATLAGTTTPVPGDGKWVGRVRMSQFNPDTVRVVLDLNDTAPCFVLHSRGNPNLIEVRTVQKIQHLNWADTEQGGRLMIEADGELVNEITELKKPEQIQIYLDYSQFSPELTAPVFKSSLVREVHLVPVSTTEARIDIDLGRLVGYNAQLSPDRRKLTINFKRSPLIGKTIILDPGHGGVDPGASGRQGTREKEVNLDVAMRLKELLENAGAAIVLTRADDSFIGLYERAFMANFLFANLFISIHTNNHPDLTVHGIEIWFRQGRNEAQELARDVLTSICQTTGFSELGIKSNRANEDFVVVREPQMPSILIELGFLSNYQEESVIMTPDFREKAAAGIFQGIINYYHD